MEDRGDVVIHGEVAKPDSYPYACLLYTSITGETGAGKSIILGAIGLLLEQRADVKAIRRGASKCIIEARFDIAAYGMRPFRCV